MANITAWNIEIRAALFASSTAVATVTLLPEFEYRVTHTGNDITGANGDTGTIMLSASGGTPATPAASTGADKLFLVSGSTLVIGPGVSTLKYDAVAGAPAFNITMNRDRDSG